MIGPARARAACVAPYRRLALALAAAAGLGTFQQARAAPDFTASEIVPAVRTVLEGDVAHFSVWLRNRGDEPANAAQVNIQWPLMGHLVAVTGLEGAQTDHVAREVSGSITLPVNGERMVDVAVLAPRDSGGRQLATSVRISHFHTMSESWMHGTIGIDTRIRSDGVRVGGVRVTTAGGLTLGWLAGTVVVVLLAPLLAGRSDGRRFFGPRAGAVAIMVAIGFWMVFAALAWRDYRVLQQWRQTTGTIIGRRVETRTVSSSRSPGSSAISPTRQSDVSKPEFAVRYPVEGRELLSTGYDTGSSLRVGGGKAQLEREFRQWTVGARVPIWYDPDDPTDIVLKRGFGGAYLFALLPAFPFWIGWWILRSNRRQA